MNSEQFIHALQSAEQKHLSYSVKDFNLTESRPTPLELQKNISCSFVASFKFGQAEVVLSQGVSINYISMDEESFQRSELERVDYLDKVILNGFEDLEGGRFDLVFLLDQLEEQQIRHPKYTCSIMQIMIDLMFELASINKDSIRNMLLNAFDDYILAMPEVKKLITHGSETKLVDVLNNMKMSDIEPKLEQATHSVENIEVADENNLYKFLSGYVTSVFDIGDLHFKMTYYMQRKYPKHNPDSKIVGINETHHDDYKYIHIDSKLGELSLDLSDTEASVELLSGSTALFFRLQSLFGMIKRQNQHPTIINKFDNFYLNHANSEQGARRRESLLAPRLDHMFWRPFY